MGEWVCVKNVSVNVCVCACGCVGVGLGESVVCVFLCVCVCVKNVSLKGIQTDRRTSRRLDVTVEDGMKNFFFKKVERKK